MTVVYSAAPFSPASVRHVLPYTDVLVMNAVESAQLAEQAEFAIENRADLTQIVTRGSEGADWIEKGVTTHVAAPKVTPVDTTGAGDCFIGYVVAGLHEGMPPKEALRLGAMAAALQVQRPGTAGAIPNRADVNALL
jgi:ribokinase